jgi:phosphoglucosamine mutase
MSDLIFGTDGIRGPVGHYPLDPGSLLKIGVAAANVLGKKGGKVIIAKDTRVSGYIFESILEGALLSAGLDVYLTGPITTPALSYYTKSYKFDFGMMISASHNSYYDNGIKFFNSEGHKLDIEIERAISDAFYKNNFQFLDADSVGKAKRLPLGINNYIDYCISRFPELFLSGFKLVLDASHGAGFKLAPRIFSGLGADVLPVGCSPNGYNINDRCGSTSPGLVAQLVKNGDYQVGVAIDGDGDRAVLTDEDGSIIDGDKLIYILAKHYKDKGILDSPIAITVVSNLGLKKSLEKLGITVVEADVGDKNVSSALRNSGGFLGGESSGHIINLNYNSTGDGVLAALQILLVMHETNKTLKDLASELKLLPSKSVNIEIDITKRNIIKDFCHEFARNKNNELHGDSRVLARLSGTEPKVRLLIECDDLETQDQIANEFTEKIGKLK